MIHKQQNVDISLPDITLNMKIIFLHTSHYTFIIIRHKRYNGRQFNI